MALEPLPLQTQIVLPLQWSATVHKIETRYANTSVSGSVGFNPVQETVTITWKLRPDQIQDWIGTFAPTFNGRFKFYCEAKQRWVVLRPTNQFSYVESPFVTPATMTFERVK